jgi:hypothetical protein
MMEKNAVVGANPQTKTASVGANCPLCGRAVDTQGSIPRCPKHGTAPFEAGPYRKRENG